MTQLSSGSATQIEHEKALNDSCELWQIECFRFKARNGYVLHHYAKRL